jgi:V/A-type H+-transporting ATPase subunit E
MSSGAGKIVESILSDSHTEADHILKEAEAREDLMEETFQKATEKLKKVASTESEDYINSLVKLTKEASLEIGGGTLKIFLKEEDIGKIEGSLIKLEKEVSESTGNETTLTIGGAIDTIGGVSVKTADGKVEVNNTIEARMERFRGILRLEVAKVLFK